MVNVNELVQAYHQGRMDAFSMALAETAKHEVPPTFGAWLYTQFQTEFAALRAISARRSLARAQGYCGDTAPNGAIYTFAHGHQDGASHD